MRNKRKCKKCIYHGGSIGRKSSITCDYSGKTDTTCLTLENGKVVDRRGNDMNNCKLFDDGRKRKNPLKKQWMQEDAI